MYKLPVSAVPGWGQKKLSRIGAKMRIILRTVDDVTFDSFVMDAVPNVGDIVNVDNRQHMVHAREFHIPTKGDKYVVLTCSNILANGSLS